VIEVPAGDPEEYATRVAQVATQLREGFTSGHVDAETHWTIEDSDEQDPDGRAWPAHDLGPCIEAGGHLIAQRHPDSDCAARPNP
jgi:hypothetical protein